MKNDWNTRLWSIPLPKFDLKMKLTLLLLLTALFALQANNSYSQKTKISLDVENMTTSSVIDEIENASDFRFVYLAKNVDLNRKITLKVKRERIEKILDLLFGQTNTDYTIEDTQILLSARKQQNPTPKQQASNQDPITVTGQVTNVDDVPLPGVSVIVKGTTRGTATDFDGNYQIVVPNNQSILVFSSIGYSEQEVTVGSQTNVNVTMKESVSQLDEVVLNAGYYRTSKRVATGNISKISSEEIDIQPITTPLQSLQGRLPGVQVSQTSGVVGGTFDIQIRGLNSLRTNGNNPLIIVDGVPYTNNPLSDVNDRAYGGVSLSPINFINPNDIESIEILKDADATAIYGSRGANGIVLITTKKGKEGKTTFEVDQSYGFGRISNQLEMLNTSEYQEMLLEGFANDGFDPIPEFLQFLVPGIFEYDSARNVNWQDEYIGGTAERLNTQMSIYGGNANTNYLFRGSYYRETTVNPGNFRLQRGSGLLSANHKSNNEKFNASFSANYVFQNSILPSSDLTLSAIPLPPNAPEPYNENGNLNFEEYGNQENPAILLERPFNGTARNLTTGANLSYQLLPSLTIKSALGYSIISQDEIRKSPILSQDPSLNPTGSTTFGNSRSESWSIEPQIEYNLNFEKGNVSFLVGTSFQSITDTRERFLATGYTSDALLENINAAPNVDVVATDFSQYKYNAFFARANFNWQNKYILNLTGRRDGSSRFGPGNRFSNFGAIGASWIFTEESFLEGNSFLSFGKIRSSYGTTGNDQIGDYEFLETYSSTTFPYLNTPGLTPTRLANPNFGWETVKKFEIALELGFFNDKLFASASYYQNRSSNQLIGIPLAGTTGFSTIQANFPATVENRGIEIEFTSKNISSDNFDWNTSFNISVPRNRLIAFPNIEQTGFNNTLTVGESIFSRKALNYLGINESTGLWEFEDVNDDGEITIPEDFVGTREAAIDFYGGINNSISFKGIQLDFLFEFRKQDAPLYPLGGFLQPGSFIGNQPTIILDRWQEPGDVTDIQRYSAGADLEAIGAFENLVSFGNNGIGDASYVRLKNVSLAYTFPKDVISQLGAKNLRVYAQGQNLFTITDYFGLDPETLLVQRLPPLRYIVMGLNIQF